MGTKNSTTTSLVAKFIGALFLVQMFAGIWLNFFFYQPLFSNPIQLSVEEMHLRLGIGVLSAVCLSSINLVVCLASRPLLGHRLQTHFACVLSFAAIALCLTMMEANRLSEFVSWIAYNNSLEKEAATQMSASTFWQEHVRHILSSGRNHTHFMAILVSSVSLLLFYSLLLRAALLPKPLLVFAVLACTLQLIAVGHALFGQNIPMLLQLPLALNQLMLPIYLWIKGFNSRPALALEVAA